jgi:hypothetical protein
VVLGLAFQDAGTARVTRLPMALRQSSVSVSQEQMNLGTQILAT